MRSKLTPRQAQRLCQTILMSVPLLSLTGCWTPMTRAALDGRTWEVDRLLKQGADINQGYTVSNLNGARFTPLMAAAHGGQIETAKFLLDNGADINAGTELGTPLLMAAWRGQTEIARLLLERGADPLRTGTRDRASAWARNHGHPELAALLEEAEAKAQRKAEKEDAASAAKASLESRLSDIEEAEKDADAAARSGEAEKALALYSEALRLTPRGTDKDIALRKKLLRFVASLDARPAVPQEAVKHLNRSQAFVKKSQDAQGYDSAAAELEQALRIAPWWATAYFNLGLVQEKAENFTGAIQSFKLYLLAAPGSSDAPAVSKKIDELEVSLEMSEPR